MKFSYLNRKAAVVAVIAAGVFSAAGANVAVAAPAAGDAVILGNAPSCVKVGVDRGIATQTGRAKNECGTRMNLKIIWAHGADGSCNTVEHGQTLKSKVAISPRVFDGASTC